MNMARAVVLVVVLALCFLTVALLGFGEREQGNAPNLKDQSKTGPQVDISTKKGYAAGAMKCDFDLTNDDELQVYLVGRVVNHGKRKLKSARLCFQYLNEKGYPRGMAKKFRLGAFVAGEARDYKFPLFKLQRSKGVRDPKNNKLLTWEKPRFRVTIQNVRFAGK